MNNDIDFNLNFNADGSTNSVDKLLKAIEKVSIACEGMINIMSKGKFGTSFEEATKQADKLDKVFKKLGKEGAVVIGEGAKDISQKINGIGDASKKTKDNVQNNFKDMFKSWGDTALGFNQISQIAQKAISILSEPIKKAGQFETLQMNLEVVMGSAEKAKERFKELADFTKGTTFEVGQVVQAGKELQSLGKYSKETLTILSNLAMGSGKSLDQITKAYTALAKGFNTDKLSFHIESDILFKMYKHTYISINIASFVILSSPYYVLQSSSTGFTRLKKYKIDFAPQISLGLNGMF